ncbi:MAG: helix-turn-helix transcriptional regulator [Proteobacteria bacterium]|nr:helix-turn-helix transcriptional regulator [Pseudomonadota bacterium]
MSNSTLVVQSIRTVLRARGMTYRELAKALGVSEPTIKRNLGNGDFSLTRLDRICEVLEVSLPELLDRTAVSTCVTELSEAQEQALVRHPKLLLLTYLLVNEWRIADIVETFDLDENAIVSALLELDRLEIIDFRPPDRIRRLTARNFSWRRDGPVHAFFVDRVASEFLRGAHGESDAFQFVGGTLSSASFARMAKAIDQLAREFEELARRDSRLPLDARDGCSAMLVLRRWECSEFTRLRRRREPHSGRK